MSYKPEEEIVAQEEQHQDQTSDIDYISNDDNKDTRISNDGYSDEDQLPVKKNNTRGFIYDLIFYAVLIFVCIYILPNFVIQRTIVDGASMENTLHNGEHLYVEKLSYRFNALDRFDIIVFYPFGRENEEYYVKRIIGLPGETVQIVDSNIYIDGKLLEEDYGREPIMDPGRAAEPITLGEDEYFVLGDNRNISKDSRSDVVGNVKRENIGGRVIFRVKPLSKFGTVD